MSGPRWHGVLLRIETGAAEPDVWVAESLLRFLLAAPPPRWRLLRRIAWNKRVREAGERRDEWAAARWWRQWLRMWAQLPHERRAGGEVRS